MVFFEEERFPFDEVDAGFFPLGLLDAGGGLGVDESSSLSGCSCTATLALFLDVLGLLLAIIQVKPNLVSKRLG